MARLHPAFTSSHASCLAPGGLLRSGILAAYPDLARGAGLDPRARLRAAGLPLQCLDDRELPVAAEGVCRLLEDSAAAAHMVGVPWTDRRPVGPQREGLRAAVSLFDNASTSILGSAHRLLDEDVAA